MKNVATGVFRLKGPKLLEMGKRQGVANIHQISLRSGISYVTAYRYFEKPEEVESVSLRALYGVIVDGFGLTPKQVADMKFGDVFELVPDKKNGNE